MLVKILVHALMYSPALLILFDGWGPGAEVSAPMMQ